jgi:hypothetical protein
MVIVCACGATILSADVVVENVPANDIDTPPIFETVNAPSVVITPSPLIALFLQLEETLLYKNISPFAGVAIVVSLRLTIAHLVYKYLCTSSCSASVKGDAVLATILPKVSVPGVHDALILKLYDAIIMYD